MKLQPSNSSHFFIKKYVENNDSKSININGIDYSKSLIIFNEVQNLEINDIYELSCEHLDALLAKKPEVVLIGTGSKQVFLHPKIYSKFINQGIGVEFMTNSAACRTYNVLLSEDRKAALILIL